MTNQRSLRRLLAASLASTVVVGGLAATSVADPGDNRPAPAPSAQGPKGKLKKAKAGDKLGQHDRQLLAQAESAKKSRVTVMIAAEKGQTASAVAAVKAVGGWVVTRNDKVGYIRASVPTNKVDAFAKDKAVLAVDLDETVQLDPVREAPGRAKGVKAGPSATTPDINDYMPTGDIGSPQFRKANPTWDGRGITIGIMDSGVDLDSAALQTTTTGERKIVGWFTATDPVFDGDATWRAMLTPVTVAPSAAGSATGTFVYRGFTYTAPVGDYYLNRFLENATNGDENGGDANRDGDNTDWWALLYDAATGTVMVDSDDDKTFAAGEAMKPYAKNYDVGHFGTVGQKNEDGSNKYLPFVVDIKKDVSLAPYGMEGTADFVNIGIVAGEHGTHVAGIAAANKLFGGTMNGGAPGAKIVSARACTYAGGCTAAALLDGMVDLATNRGVDIINMSIGGLPALNDGANARAQVYNRLIDTTGVQMFISAGNEGAGANTIGDPSVASKVVSVASSITKASWLANYGSVASRTNDLHPFSSRGPAEDGAFKPNVSAPGSAISTIPVWMAATTTPAGDKLPAGYAMLQGTSMASPQATGAATLLLSAAKATGRTVTPKVLRESIYSSAKQIPNVQVNGQGTGLFNVADAWKLLTGPTTKYDYTVDTEVCTPISNFLQTPHRGSGVYNRCAAAAGGDKAGKTQMYQVKITRTSGPATPTVHSVKIVGNDGTWRTSPRVAIPLNRTITLHVSASPATSGLHSAFLLIDDPKTSLQDLRVMLNTAPADELASPLYSKSYAGTVERNQVRSFFVNVPAGVDAIQANLTGVAGADQVRFIGVNPYGVPVDDTSTIKCYTSYGDTPGNGCKPTSRAYENPLPGVWEFYVESRRTSPSLVNPYNLKLSLQGVTVTPAVQTIAPSASGPTAVTWTVRNDLGAISLKPVGGPLGSALAEQKSISEGEKQHFDVEVPAGATSLTVSIGNTSDLGADLDLYLYDSNGDEVTYDADGDSNESITILNPAADTYTVEVDGYAVPAGTTTYDYFDGFTSPSLGTLTITSASPVLLAGNATVTVTGSVTSTATPVEGRKIYGEMKAQTTEGATLGKGTVIIAATP